MELRFFHALPAEKRQAWVAKWLATGGKLYDGRLIALKNDPVWRAMTGAKRLKGEAERFMIFRAWDVTRKECVSLGLIVPTEILEPTAFDDLAPAFLTRKYPRALDGPIRSG